MIRSRSFRRPFRPRLGSTFAILAIAGLAPVASADEVMLQWFENSWSNLELRMPDFFLAGYNATWLPPVMLPGDPTSPGYDQFDKFNLGTPNNQTIYGTEAGFRQVVEQFHRAGANVYVDTILNHASAQRQRGLHGRRRIPGLLAEPARERRQVDRRELGRLPQRNDSIG
ncbi:MAG: alpha-amylase family glycosyl hydrolase [Phycisphaerales bacterium]